MIELWRALVETGALVVEDGRAHLMRTPEELGSPDAVREVVSQRLARLDATTTGVLELAAVVGPEFDLTVLAGGTGIDESALLGAVDLALRSGMVAAVPERPLGYCFAHELVRRALYDRLAAPRRAELHLRAGEALEAASPQPSARTLADLARHFTAAAPLGATERAVTYNVRAAAAATAALAFDEAVAALRTALGLGVAGELRRAEIELALGDACYRGGRGFEALVAYRAAADIARDRGNGELFAQAAVGFENACWRMAAINEGALDLLTEAAAILPETDSSLRVMVLSGLARACAFVGDHDRSATLRHDAIAMARRMDDRPALATVLMRAYWARGTTSLDEILAMLTESRDLADELGLIELQAEAMEWRISALIALGDLEAAREELAVVFEMASRVGQPFIIHVAEHYRSAIALCSGRLAEAEATAERSFEWGRLLTGRDPSGSYGIQMFGIRREQGRLAELAPVVRILAASGEQGGGAWGPGLVALLAELGMHDEARRELRRVHRRGLSELRAGLWLASLTYLADACALVRDDRIASDLYAELARYAGAIVTIGHGVACYGSADRYLGIVAAVAGEHDLARPTWRSRLRPTAAWAPGHGSPTPSTSSAGSCWRGSPATARAEASCCRRRARWPSESGCRRCFTRSGPRAGRSHPAPTARRALAPGAPDPAVGRTRHVQPRDRSRSGGQRAHCGKPRSQHPAQDRLRQPHRGHRLRVPARADGCSRSE